MAERRVVLVMLEPPLPFGNAAARWYYVLLRGLTERGYAVTALASCTKPHEVGSALDLFRRPQYDLQCFVPDRRSGLRAKVETVRRPHSYLFSEAMRGAVASALAAPDTLLHLETQWSGWLGLRHAGRALVNVQYLFGVDLADVPVHGASARAMRARTLATERTLLRRYPTITTVSPRLTAEVGRINPRAAVHTVPLGTDLSLYPFRGDRRRGGPPTVGLIGSFNWQPTLDAAHRLVTRLWPEIRRRVPGARLLLVGREAIAAVRRIDPALDATVVENVPDALPYFDELDLLLYAPSRGSGTKVKVVEAFALGVPVVTTTDGAEGIPAVDGVHAGISDDNAGLVRRAVALLGDPEAADRQRRRARALVEQHLSPGPALDALEGVYEGVYASMGAGGLVAAL